MKYSEFNQKVKTTLGNWYSVHYDDYSLRVSYKGEWVATVALNKRLSYTFQQAWEGYWGTEELRQACIELVDQLAETKPENRGRIPADVKHDSDTLVLI